MGGCGIEGTSDYTALHELAEKVKNY